MGSKATTLSVVVGDERGRPVRIPGLAAWLTRVAPPRARGMVSIALVSDRRMRFLNREYRGKDVATDVLSFEGGIGRNGGSRHGVTVLPVQPVPPVLPPPFLGEIVIARGVARRQARKARHSELSELKLLALHGLLHLLGYDHEQDNGAMRRMERRLRAKGGLREGLIERGRTKP